MPSASVSQPDLLWLLLRMIDAPRGRTRKFTGGGFVHSERPPDGEGMPMASMTNNVPLALPAGVIFMIDQVRV